MLLEIGKPVAYYPEIARMLGGVKEGIFVCQLVYWVGKGNKDDWVFKTQEEWQAETGLSVREQLSTRRRLKTLNLIEERHDRLQHKMYYKLNIKVLNDMWDAYFPNRPTVAPRIDQCVTPESTVGGFDNNVTENTTENTTYKKKILKEKFLEFVLLTKTEHEKLVEKFGEETTNDLIERLNNYVGSKGAKYKSHYHTVLNWANKDGLTAQTKPKKESVYQKALRVVRPEYFKGEKHG